MSGVITSRNNSRLEDDWKGSEPEREGTGEILREMVESSKPVGRIQVVGRPQEMQWTDCEPLGLCRAPDSRQRKSQIMIVRNLYNLHNLTFLKSLYYNPNSSSVPTRKHRIPSPLLLAFSSGVPHSSNYVLYAFFKLEVA